MYLPCSLVYILPTNLEVLTNVTHTTIKHFPEDTLLNIYNRENLKRHKLHTFTPMPVEVKEAMLFLLLIIVIIVIA